MSRAWLAGGRLHLQCDHCSSSGTPAGARVTQQIPDALRAGYREFGQKLSALVGAFQAQTAALRFNRTMSNADRLKTRDAARAKLDTDMTALLKSRPDRAGIRVLIESCPWCGEKLGVEIEKETA